MLVLFQYCPVQYFWTGWLDQNGKALDQNFVELVTYGFAGVGAASDWALVLISPWFFWSKDFNRRVKFCFRLLMILGMWWVMLARTLFSMRLIGIVLGPLASLEFRRPRLFSQVKISSWIAFLLRLGKWFPKPEKLKAFQTNKQSSNVECGLGMVALSATTFRALCPQFFSAEPKEVPVSPAPSKVEEKTSMDSNSIRKSYLTTGAEISNRMTTQRKPSQERSWDVVTPSLDIFPIWCTHYGYRKVILIMTSNPEAISSVWFGWWLTELLWTSK